VAPNTARSEDNAGAHLHYRASQAAQLAMVRPALSLSRVCAIVSVYSFDAVYYFLFAACILILAQDMSVCVRARECAHAHFCDEKCAWVSDGDSTPARLK
jgi:hypothetical protein